MEKSKISFRFIITYSKLFALLMLVLGFIISYALKEATVITIAIVTSGALVGNKQYQDRIKATQVPQNTVTDTTNNTKTEQNVKTE